MKLHLYDDAQPLDEFVVIPIFALANAGIHLSTDWISNLWSSPVSIGVILGLVLRGVTPQGPSPADDESDPKSAEPVPT